MTTKQYWIEAFQDFVYREAAADTKLALDDVDVTEYLAMAVESVYKDLQLPTAARPKQLWGVSISGFAVWYKALAIDCINDKSATVLTHSPLLGTSGIVSVSSCGVTFFPRKAGVEVQVLSLLKNASVIPTYTIDGKSLLWEYPPSVKAVDVFMVPNMNELSNAEEFTIPPGCKEFVFQKVFSLLTARKPTPMRNNTNPNDTQ